MKWINQDHWLWSVALYAAILAACISFLLERHRIIDFIFAVPFCGGLAFSIWHRDRRRPGQK
jgi:hypothetical protein